MKPKKKIIPKFFATVLLLQSSMLMGQSLFDGLATTNTAQEKKSNSLELGGFSRGVAQGGAKDYDFSSVYGEFGLKSRYDKQKVSVYADMRIREGMFFNAQELQLQLKEAYVSYKTQKLDIFLGNQIVVWGRTDGFNPTNNITPNDYFFLSYEPDDQKLSNFMLRTKWKPIGIADLEVVVIPFYRPSNYRYDLFKTGQPATFNPIKHPGAEFQNGSLAARLNFELSRIGFSTSYFIGHNPFYGFNYDSYSIIPLSIIFEPKPYFTQIIGADFAIPISSWLVRGEMALNLTKDYEVKKNTHIPNPDFSYVLGVEKTFWDVIAIFQYVGKYTFNYSPLKEPVLADYIGLNLLQYIDDLIVYEAATYNRKIFNQQAQMNHMLFLALNRSFAYDQFNVELAGTYNITTQEYMARGRVKWSISDALSANVGYNYMLGPTESIFNMSGRVMNGISVGLEVTF